MEALIFYLIAIIAVAAALLMIFGRNATHSVLAMVLNFSMVAVLYLLLGAPFLAAVQVLVYAGAILVLFLFVVMLMGNDPGPLWEQIPLQRPIALIFVLLLLIGMVPALDRVYLTGARGAALAGTLTDEPSALAGVLFSGYVLPFEVTAVILLVAMIGAVVLAKRSAYRTEREQELQLDDV